MMRIAKIFPKGGSLAIRLPAEFRFEGSEVIIEQAGLPLFEAMLDAADRGVRVRLLIDDYNTAGLDPTLAVLDAHEHIEGRLFNPFVHRQQRWLSYLTDFRRINRRMHNKSFTADDQMAILGGRNIGDEYFSATDKVAFADMDMLAVGPVVNEISTDFKVWISRLSPIRSSPPIRA